MPWKLCKTRYSHIKYYTKRKPTFSLNETVIASLRRARWSDATKFEKNMDRLYTNAKDQIPTARIYIRVDSFIYCIFFSFPVVFVG